MADLYFYSTPPTASVELTLDSGATYRGESCSVEGRDDAHRFTFPDGTATQGALLQVSADGCTAFEGRGILKPDVGEFVFDDIHLSPVPVPEPAPPLDPYLDPYSVIVDLFHSGDYDCSTHDGCGLFTEACAKELHERQSNMWGHIRKTPGQNQFNEHAIDAIQLLAKAGNTDPRIYDIIHDSVSPNASPIFIDKGPADSNLWFYPPKPVA